MALFLSFGLAAIADVHDDIGATRLANELGAAMPTGANIDVGLVEQRVGDGFMPDTDDAEFPGKTFYNSTPNGLLTNSSGHATKSGRRFVGISSSVAPGVTEIDCYHWDSFRSDAILTPQIPDSTDQPEPLVLTRRVYNFSVATIGDGTNLTQRMDYAVDRDGVMAVGAVLNYPTMNMFLASGYNIISVGTSDGDHSTGGTLYDGVGRIKPEIVVPGIAFTSFCTPVVAGAAAMLLEVVDGNPALVEAGRPQTLKAILMAGATKDEFPNWTRTHGRPLDKTFGSGELNVYNSYHVLTSGRQPNSTTNVVGVKGWDYQELPDATNRWYFFEIPAGIWLTDFSAILTWHRRIVDSDPSPHFAPVSVLADLDLHLYQATNFTPTTRMDFSTSRVDNVEHIYLRNLGPGRYAFNVEADSSADYALAWYGVPLEVAATGPVTLTADSNTQLHLSATPESLAPISGTGEAASPFFYHSGDGPLDMASYTIRSPLTNTSARFFFPSVSYDVGSSGGAFNFSGVNQRGNLLVESSGPLELREMRTDSTSAANKMGGGGNLTVHAGGDLIIAGVINANAVGSNNKGGIISLASETGSVHVAGLISSSCDDHASSITVRGQSVGVSNLAAFTSSTSRNGGNITLTSTAGSIRAGLIEAYGGEQGGALTLSSTGGDIATQKLDVRSRATTSSNGGAAGSITIYSDGSVSVGALDASNNRTTANENGDYGGSVKIQAVGDVIVTGDILTYVSSLPVHAYLRSYGGSVSIASETGHLFLEGAVDAFSPAIQWDDREWRGALELTAEKGGITLASLDVARLGKITLKAAPTSGTLIQGPLTGLEDDIVDGVVNRLHSVQGHVYYDASLPANAYLGGVTYPIVIEVGGGPRVLDVGLQDETYSLKPRTSEPAATEVDRLEWVDGALRTTFMGEGGVAYRLWYTTNLTAQPPHWEQTEYAIGGEGEVILEDTDAMDPLRIYRIEAN